MELKKNRRKSYLVGIFILSAILICFCCFLFFESENKQIHQLKEKELETIALLKTDQISNWYLDENSDAGLLVQNHDLIRRVEKYFLVDDASVRNELQGFLRLISQEHGLSQIVVSTPDCRKEFLAYDQLSALDFRSVQLISNAISNDRVICSDLYRSDLDHHLYIDYISPVRNLSGKIIAAVVFRHDPENFLFPLIKKWPVPSSTSETLIIRKDGDSVLFLNDLRHYKDAALHLKYAIDDHTIPAIHAVKGNRGLIVGPDYRGQEVLAYVDSIPGTNWYIVAKTDLNEIFSEMNFEAGAVFLLFVLLLLLLLFIFIFIIRERQMATLKQLLQTRQEFETTLYSIGDAVITTDQNSIIQYINPVAEKLTGWKRAEALGNPIEKVFKIINEETSNEVENPIQKVLKEGATVGLTNHTLLISKDGKSIPISDSGSPIRNDAGLIVGVVLVFRDQTEERIKQRSVEEANRRMSMFFSNLNGMAYMATTDPVRSMEFVSEGCHELTGYPAEELIQNQRISFEELIFPDDRLMVREKINEGLSKRQKYQIEYRMMHISGRKKWVWEHGQGVFDADNHLSGIEGYIIDITERKQSEKALKESQKLFKTLAENATVGIFQTDREGRTTYVNQRYCELSALSFNEALEYGWLKHIHPDYREAIFNGWQNATSVETGSKGEYCFIHPDGKVVWVKGQAVAEFDDAGHVLGYIGTITDITEIKEALEELKKIRDDLEIAQKMASVGSWIWNIKENKVFWTEQMYRNLGFDKESFAGEPFTIENFHLHPNDRDRVLELSRAAMNTNEPISIEFRLFWPDGTEHVVWLETGGVQNDNNGHPLLLCGILQDISERKHSEERIRFLSGMVENSQGEIYIFNSETLRFVYVNQGALKNLGYSFSEMEKMTPIDIKPEFDTDTFHEMVKPLLDGDMSMLTFETIHQRMNGSTYPVEIQLQIFIYEGEKTFAAFVRDISKRKEAENALINSNLLLRAIIDNLPDAVYMKDTQGRKVIANKLDVENCGVASEAELIGKNDFDLFPPDIATNFWNDDMQVIKTGTPVLNHVEKLGNNRNDQRWLRTSKIPYRDSHGNIIGLVGIGHDITKWKLAEDEMLKLSRAIIQSPVSIIITDPKGKIEYVNPKFSEVTGYSYQESIGENPRILKSGLQSDEFYKTLWDTILSGNDWKGEMQNLKKNGELYWESVSISPIVNDEGTIAYFVAVKEDITQRKKLDLELVLAKEKAEESDHLKSSFLANMSHEIRTPLNSIIGFASFLASDEELSAEEKILYSDIINKSSENLLQIISDILDISRLETGQLNIKYTQVDIDELFNQILIQFNKRKAEVGKNEIELVACNETGLKTIVVDELRMNQIFINLIGNALKFTEKGSIRFGVSHFDNKRIDLFVSDTGIGIADEMQTIIFDRFLQVDDFKNRSHGGNGLGLAIAKNLIELMGGEIRLESELGKGTTFKFFLPNRKE